MHMPSFSKQPAILILGVIDQKELGIKTRTYLLFEGLVILVLPSRHGYDGVVASLAPKNGTAPMPNMVKLMKQVQHTLLVSMVDSAPGLSALRAVAVSRTSAILSCSPSRAALPPNFSLTTSKLAACARAQALI